MNNYHSLMGIVAGLNMSSIVRLKHTINDVPQAVRASLFSLSFVCQWHAACGV